MQERRQAKVVIYQHKKVGFFTESNFFFYIGPTRQTI